MEETAPVGQLPGRCSLSLSKLFANSREMGSYFCTNIASGAFQYCPSSHGLCGDTEIMCVHAFLLQLPSPWLFLKFQHQGGSRHGSSWKGMLLLKSPPDGATPHKEERRKHISSFQERQRSSLFHSSTKPA
eukprot:gb/GECG01004776.1/.p1 GENE.gb/GECG01004776.1/~~gb/GECG01004776.1/.p1  ORF type:complete len:131 (+),score=8.32 gb/GECG01004776.1/:1-393(+)